MVQRLAQPGAGIEAVNVDCYSGCRGRLGGDLFQRQQTIAASDAEFDDRNARVTQLPR